jgi:ketosteroid isomerase-like protein
MNDKALEWLRQWESMINAADFAGARRLFSPDVISFGTLTGFMSGLQELEKLQWRKIWPTIKDFKFDHPVVVFSGEPAPSAVIVSLWHSKGKTGSGGWYDRKGRATLVLRLEMSRLRCCHSHLSMDPGIPPLWKTQQTSSTKA